MWENATDGVRAEFEAMEEEDEARLERCHFIFSVVLRNYAHLF